MVTTCYATQARDDFASDHKDLPDSELIGMRLLPPGQEATDPLAFDPARAAAEYAAHLAKHGMG